MLADADTRRRRYFKLIRSFKSRSQRLRILTPMILILRKGANGDASDSIFDGFQPLWL